MALAGHERVHCLVDELVHGSQPPAGVEHVFAEAVDAAKQVVAPGGLEPLHVPVAQVAALKHVLGVELGRLGGQGVEPHALQPGPAALLVDEVEHVVLGQAVGIEVG